MADEKIYEWSSDKALSKVKIGGETYKLKDAEARQVIDAEVSRATAAEASLAAEISDEVSRATAAEASIAADLASEVSRATGVEADHDTRIRNLEARGRYLSTWNAETGLPGDYPTIPEGQTSPYTYSFKAGDYYIVNNVPATGTKYMPDGASITATKSGETWTWTVGKKETTDAVSKGDQYVYSTTSWTHIAAAKDVAWGNITGELSKQTDLQAALDAKSTVSVSATGSATDQVSYITIDGVEKKLSDVDKAYVDAELSKKVDKNGTDRLMTAAEGTKLAGIASNAQVNVIEVVKVGGTALEVSAKAVDIEVQEAGSLALKNVASFADLDASLQTTISNKVDKVSGKSLIDDTLITKLEGIEASAQVNVVEKIKVGSTVHTADASKVIDLGDIALTSGVVTNVAATTSENVITLTKTIGSTTTDVQVFGKLANKNSASGTVSVGTVSGVKATGSSTGEIAVVLDQTATAIESTGSIVATGTIGVTLNNNEVSKLKTAGTLPTYAHSGFVGGSKASDTFTQGSLPSIDNTKFSGGSLSAAATAKFAQEGIKAKAGDGTEGFEDTECLYFNDANKADAVTAQGTLTPAAIGTDFFNAGSLPTFSEGAFTPAVYGSDTFTQGAMPTFDDVTVGVASATFTGSSVNFTASGSYDKATVNTAGTKFTGKAISLDVGDIVIGDKNVTVQ